MTYFSSKIIKIFFCGYDRYYWLKPFNVAIVYRHVCVVVTFVPLHEIDKVQGDSTR